MNRNLDGYYFRVYREGKYQDVCFTDLTDEETEAMLNDRTDEWLMSLYEGLCGVYLVISPFLSEAEMDEARSKFERATITDGWKEKIIKSKHNILCMAEIAGIVGEE